MIPLNAKVSVFYLVKAIVKSMIKILKKLSWLIIYLLFNAVIFFIEIHVLFKKNDTNYSSNSGFSLLDQFFNILEGFAIVGFVYAAVGLTIVSFMLFIPLQIYYIEVKYKNNKNKFWFSLLVSFSVVIILKLILHCWRFVDLNYL